MNKKWMGRLLVGIGIVMASLLVATPIAAMWDWCEVDPTLGIGTHTVVLEAGMQGDPQLVIGQTVFNVSVPWGTSVSIVSVEKGAKVNVNYCGVAPDNTIPVRVCVDIKIKGKTSYPTRLMVSVDGKPPTTIDQSTTDRCLSGSFNLTGTSSDDHDNGHDNGHNQGNNGNGNGNGNGHR